MTSQRHVDAAPDEDTAVRIRRLCAALLDVIRHLPAGAVLSAGRTTDPTDPGPGIEQG